MLHKMKLNESPFERIKNGSKTIEFRLYDEKRQKVKIGDKIEFSKLPDLQEKLLVDVIDLYREDTFEDLFKKLYTDEKEIASKTQGMYKIYSPEKEQQYGVLGIKIKINVDDLKENIKKFVPCNEHKKFSESAKIEKEYTHYFYDVNIDTKLNQNEFEINGVKYKWFSYAELISNERIQKVNSDIVKFVKDFGM